ncbi:relaxase/mobilization nuclease domain-containing protein [uncultured Algoriphagus sp.]|uniref:relaxase/mobilization nuclease domain-containing protein n=1 Tax=uncultured Algoriphagus sp. TaxID=417365 RepID=UPI0030EE9FC4|tara:strand:+ start:51480 stop:52763 length:1284 start_codon:yes stop_codon:yes gene_type:complete
MVAIIKTSASLRRPFHYNENKVEQGVAELLFTQNYPVEEASQSADIRLKYMLKLTELNSRTTVNAVHISLNFAPGEDFEAKKLQAIAKEYMSGIDFENQPYLVYKHNDAGHPHLHIVTTNIALDGKRIPLHNIGKLKSEPTRKAIEIKFGLVPAEAQKKGLFIAEPISIARLEYGKSETKQAIGNVLQHILKNYRFTSLPELNAVLKGYNIVADRGTETSRIFKNRGLVYRVLDSEGNKVGVPIKASSFHFRATLNAIESKFEANKVERKKHINSIRSAIDLTIMKMPESSLDELIKSLEKQGIVIVKRENEEGRLYGVTYVDHRTKCVFNGSALGKKYSANGLIKRMEINSKNEAISPQAFIRSANQTKVNQGDNRLVELGVDRKNRRGDDSFRGVLESLITPDESYNFLPFEWRKKKRKKRKVTK